MFGRFTGRFDTMTGNSRISRMRHIIGSMREDLNVVVDRDPSIASRAEALLHPSIAALWSHRCARPLYLAGWKIGARMIMVLGRAVSGIELHPGADIGRRFFVDHGAATVVGETCVIGDDVTLFHQVTLGAIGYWKDRERPSSEARHPRLGSGVVVGANATILGPVTIGDHAAVGAHSIVMSDVDPGGRIRATQSPQHRPRPLVQRIPATPQSGVHSTARALVSPEGGWMW